MRAIPNPKSGAFTLIELVLVIIVVVMVLALFPVAFGSSRTKARRNACVNNLKQIGTAYRIWPSGQSDLYPAQESVTRHGWKDCLTNRNQGSLVWTNYSLMASELSTNPHVVVCPSDERKPADAFSDLHSDLNISYFVGVSANVDEPGSLLGGDRNLAPGNAPKNDYGFSPTSGKGNDVALQINTQTNPICWSLKMHSGGNTRGAGNILLGDASVQQCTSTAFRQIWLHNTGETNNSRQEPGDTENWPTGYMPPYPAIRVLFP